MDILDKLFGGGAKVRIIKLFLFNPEVSYDAGQVAGRTQVSLGLARREIANLSKLGLIREKAFNKEIRVQKERRSVLAKKRANGWILNYKFAHLEPLYNFLSEMNILKPEEIITKLSKGVKIELLIISGIFMKKMDSRVDLLVVGENIKENMLEDIIKDIEASIGREIKYSVFNTKDFRYRVSVFDRLIRDILDYPHQKLVNKLGI